MLLDHYPLGGRGGNAAEQNALRLGGLAGLEDDGRLRKTEGLSKRLDQLLVRLAIDWRTTDLHLQRVTE